ncbi:MAG: hypothetical protein L6R40_001670 [Gallowayella cf. fulva]|nr:MAG: hypothetical protein L6R40_001670 [Xanthomendoza cf. fulva]
MSASPAPQAFRGSKPTARAGPTDPSRGNRPGHEHLAARKARSTSGFTNHVLPSPSRQPSRSGPTHRPSSRPAPRGPSLYRSQSRQSRPAATSSPAFKNDGLRDATTQEPPVYKKYMENTFSTLGEQRKQERKDAIRNGLLADPDKPTTLASAITIVGTCQDMCAEYERVQRVVQFMVDDCEKVRIGAGLERATG